MRHVYQGTFKDQNGAVVGSSTTSDGNPGTVTVYLSGTSTLANVYTASTGGVSVNSVTTDAYGYFYFWVDENDYNWNQLFKIILTHPDFTTRTYENIGIFPTPLRCDHNHVLNGDFRLSLNPGPLALTSSFVYATVDGWAVSQNTVAAGISEQVDSGLTSFQKSLKIGRNAASELTNAIVVQQALSTSDSIPLAGKSVVFSYYAKAGANFSGININAVIVTSTGTDQTVSTMGSWTGFSASVGSNQEITTTWTRYEAIGTIPTSTTQIGIRFYYTPSGTAGADDNLYLTGVQLEKGVVVTDFELKPYIYEIDLLRPKAVTMGRLSNLVTTTGPISGSDPFDSCHFIPHDGNLIIINDKYEVIPSGVLAVSGGVIANYSDCSVDKVLNQTLANDTFYFVYVYMLNGVMTIDFSTTAYVPDTYNQTKSGDASCTHIGICQIHNVSGIPCTRGGARAQTIASYHNAFRVTLETSVMGPTAETSAAQLPDGATLPTGEPQDNYLEWVQYGDTAPRITALATSGNSGAGNVVNLGIGLNSKSVISGHTAKAVVPSTANESVNLVARASPSDQTAFCYSQAIGFTNAGTMQALGIMHADGCEA
jgi:hypothetical protein